MPASPANIYPSYLTWLGVAREAPGQVGVAVAPTGAIPLDPGSYEPEDTPHFLPDEAIRGSMVHLYNEILGVEDATFSFGGPMFIGAEAFFLDNLFGDLSSTGTSNGSAATTLAAGGALAGATAATLTLGTNFASTQNVQIDTGSIAEVVTLTNVSGSVATFASTPLRFAHNSGGTVFTVTSPYTHRFATLNSGTGQPPTHTFTDFTGITPTVGARAYVGACVAQLDMSGNAEQLLTWKVSGSSWLSAAASTKPTAFTSFSTPVPNWRGTASVAGTAVTNIGEWSVSMKRPLQIYWTASNQQNPYIIARGPLDATGTINYTVAIDETPLTLMLNNTQPSYSVAIDNGLAGANRLNVTFTSTKTAYVKSKVMRNAELVGFQDEFQCVANVTDVGGSAGLGPCTVTIINNIPTY